MLDDYLQGDYLKDYNTLEDELAIEVGEFFRDNLLRTRAAVTERSFREFKALGSDGARVAFVLGYPQAHELPVEVENYELKDPVKTKALKESGNVSFGFDHFQVSLDEYNKAVITAPKEDLSVVLANRAASFYHMDQLRLALQDCEEALKVGYPKHLLYKLEERRARCYLGLKCNAMATDAFKCAIRALDDARLPTARRSKFQSDVLIMIAVLEKGREMNKAQRGLSHEKLLRMESERLISMDKAPRIEKCNPLYPACSKAVEIRDTGGIEGRHAVATRDIGPGELLVVERPHCAVLLDEYRQTHCHKCLIRPEAPYPASCYRCTSIVYCSPRCRDLDEAVHEVECGLLGSLWCSKASVVCALALRAVIQQPYEEFVKIKDGLDAGEVKPYLGNDYKTFYNLITHEEERTEEDLFHRAFMAAWLLRVLKTSSYFPKTVKTPDVAGTPLSEGETFVAGAILHHLQLLQFNSHEISEFTRNKAKPNLSKGKSLFIGGGVYPTVALFNHSCNPGVVRYFIDNVIIVRAIRTIPAGAEICENYGPIFTEVEEGERQRRLRLQYWFDCNCEACKNHWPLLKDIDPNILRFKCDTGPSCGNVLNVNINSDEFMIDCSKCGKSTNLLKGLKVMQDTDAIYKIASRNLKDGKPKEALKSYLEILKILDETLAMPVKDYHVCQQGIRQCMLALGNSSVL